MVSVLTPGWIRKLKDEADKAKVESAANAAANQIAHLKIQRDSPAFWRDLLVELHITAESLPQIGDVRGTLSCGSENGGESTCRLEVVQGSQFPRINHLDLFYRPSTGSIRCLTLQGKAYVFSFCLDDDQNVVVLEKSGFELLTVAKLAQCITEICLG